MKKLLFLSLLIFLTSALWAQAPAGFLKLGNVSAVTYTDSTCPDGLTCYYVVTTVDAQGFESQPAPCKAGSDPGCTGNLLFPDIRQYDERVFQNDPLGGGVQPPAFPTGTMFALKEN